MQSFPSKKPSNAAVAVDAAVDNAEVRATRSSARIKNKKVLRGNDYESEDENRDANTPKKKKAKPNTTRKQASPKAKRLPANSKKKGKARKKKV